MQVNRLFEIIYFLLDKNHVTAMELAQYFGVSTRTIYRDIDILSAAGIPVYMTKGKGGGISLLPNFILNKTLLTEQEKTEILSALRAVDAVNFNESNTAIRKLSSMFGSNQADWIEIDFSPWEDGNKEALVFQDLKESILHKQRVRFLYHNVRGEKTERTVEPLKLCFKGQGWYLYAYCIFKKDFRFFKLRRIKELCILEEFFDRLIPEKVLKEQKISCSQLITIEMKLSKEVAYRVYDEFENYNKLDDDSFIVTLTVPKEEWLYDYISTFGEHCQVLQPESVRMEVKERLQKTLQHYL